MNWENFRGFPIPAEVMDPDLYFPLKVSKRGAHFGSKRPQSFAEFIRSVQYKPGCELYVRGQEFGLREDIYVISAVMQVDCAYTGHRIKIVHDQKIAVDVAERMPSEARKHFIHDFFLRMEHHEVGEFLVINGERPFDPHKKERENATSPGSPKPDDRSGKKESDGQGLLPCDEPQRTPPGQEARPHLRQGEKVKIKATEQQVRQMAMLAIEASGPMGLGHLHYSPEILTHAGDLHVNSHGLSLDYVEGRMVKLRVAKIPGDDNLWELPAGHPHPEYQSWCHTFPTYAALARAVPGIEVQP